jgi:hypothetical protein
MLLQMSSNSGCFLASTKTATPDNDIDPLAAGLLRGVGSIPLAGGGIFAVAVAFVVDVVTSVAVDAAMHVQGQSFK